MGGNGEKKQKLELNCSSKMYPPENYNTNRKDSLLRSYALYLAPILGGKGTRLWGVIFYKQ